MINHFVKSRCKAFQPSTIFVNIFIIEVWQGSKYISAWDLFKLKGLWWRGPSHINYVRSLFYKRGEPDQNRMAVDVRDLTPSVLSMFIVLFQKLTNFFNFEIFDLFFAKYFKQQNREFFYATVFLWIFILYISSLLRTFSFS